MCCVRRYFPESRRHVRTVTFLLYCLLREAKSPCAVAPGCGHPPDRIRDKRIRSNGRFDAASVPRPARPVLFRKMCEKFFAATIACPAHIAEHAPQFVAFFWRHNAAQSVENILRRATLAAHFPEKVIARCRQIIVRSILLAPRLRKAIILKGLAIGFRRINHKKRMGRDGV